jgi:hypothetical protein
MTTKPQPGSVRTTRLFLHDVHDLGRLDGRDELFRQELRTSLLRQALQQTTNYTTGHPRTEVAPSHAPRARTHGPRLSGTWRVRLACVAAALALALSGAQGSLPGILHLGAPAPVSAQTVLSRAAAAMRLAPNQAAHLIYRVAVTPLAGQVAAKRVAVTPPAGQAGGSAPPLPTRGGMVQPPSAGMVSSTADVWVQADARGAPTMSSQTLTAFGVHLEESGNIAHHGAARRHTLDTGRVREAGGLPITDHYVQIGGQVYGYDSGNNAIIVPGTHDEHPSWMVPNDALDGAGVAQELSALAQRSPGQVQVLPQQTLEGSGVDVLQVNGWTDAPAMRTTFYFDAQSFVLRGFDAVSIDPAYPTPSWQVRLEGYTMLDAAAVPPHTFTVNAPADARVEPFRLDPATFVPAFAAACHSKLGVGQLEQILAAKQQTLLAACQATAPAMSRDALVAALLAPNRAALDGALSTGQISPAQEDAALAAQQQWLTAFVTTPGVKPPQ